MTILTSLITWTATDTKDMLGYAGDLLSDLQPFLTPIVGILLGLIVFGVIVQLIRGH